MHQTFNPTAADLTPLGPQSRMHARRAVATFMAGLQAAHVLQELPISERPHTVRSGAPRVITAGGDVEHAAHETHRPGAYMLLDEAEPHFGIPAKMPTAFFKTSHSIRVRSSSRRSRATSAA